MQPVKLIRIKRTNFYNPARKVWYQKNNDIPKSPKPRSKGGTDEEWNRYHKDYAEWEKKAVKEGKVILV